MNYYPHCPRPDLTLGLKRHTNPGTLTILLQEKVGGLQGTKDDSKTWVTVEPIDGDFVVNLGDQMHVSVRVLLYSIICLVLLYLLICFFFKNAICVDCRSENILRFYIDFRFGEYLGISL